MRDVPQLKLVREGQGWSQRDLAARSGVAPNTISQLERGERQAMPSTVRKLADALDVEPAMLLAESYLDMVIAKGAQGILTLPQEAREAAKIERERRARVRATAKRQAERQFFGFEEGAEERYETQSWAERYVSGKFVEVDGSISPEQKDAILSRARHRYLQRMGPALAQCNEDLFVARSFLESNDPKKTMEAAQLVLHRAREIAEEYDSRLQSFHRIPEHYYADPAAHSQIMKLQEALPEQREVAADAVRELMNLYDEILDTLEDQIGAMREEGDALEAFVRQA
jgi:transcriptional regulator with XRE-family HTH domain